MPISRSAATRIEVFELAVRHARRGLDWNALTLAAPRVPAPGAKSIVATVAVVNGHSRTFVGRDVDLGTGMLRPPVDGSYPLGVVTAADRRGPAAR